MHRIADLSAVSASLSRGGFQVSASYYAQYASLDAGEAGSSEAALQEAINEGARQSWKLISVTQDPTTDGVLLVWDTSGFFSG